MIEDLFSNAGLSRRIREIRVELFGDGQTGLNAIAEALAIPFRTWMNHEKGVIMPAGLMLQFLLITGAKARWLATGLGPRLGDNATAFADRSLRADHSNEGGTIERPSAGTRR